MKKQIYEAMKNVLFILVLLLPAAARAQETPEVEEIALNDSLSVRLRQITREQYETRRQTSAHLQHKSYKAVTDIDSAVRMLGGRLKVIPVEGSEYTNYEITFTDGTTLQLDEEFGFVAWFPQLEILFFEGGHATQYMFDLNEGAIDGNPFYHAVSPDKKWRINGFHDGQDCTLRFLEKWNKSEKKYENIGYFVDYQNMGLCYSGNFFWTDNNTAIFTNIGGTEVEHINEYTEFYEMTIIERREINHSQNNDNMIEVAFKHEATAGSLTVRYDDYMHETATFDPDGPEVSGTVYSLTLTHRDADGKPIREETVEFDSYKFETQGWILLTWEPYEIRIVAHGEKSLKMEIKERAQ